MSDNQYGFKEGYSTTMALTDLVDKIAIAIDKKLHTISIFFYLGKAFDIIDHSLLLKKLEHYGIRGTANRWLSTYLTGRKHFVEINFLKSKHKQMMRGVPQRSILGPKLFLLYINDNWNVSSDSKYMLYAEDTSILCSSNNITKSCNTMNKNLEELKTCFIVNKLSLSIKKKKLPVIFSNKGIDRFDISLKIDLRLIKQVMITKFLGVMIDSHLQWKEHINCVNLKSSKCIAIMYNLRVIFTANTMKQLYNSFIFPYIDYFLEVWCRTYSSNVNTVYVMQKEAIRIIFNAHYNEHRNDYFMELNATKLFDLLKSKTGFSMYKANENLLP